VAGHHRVLDAEHLHLLLEPLAERQGGHLLTLDALVGGAEEVHHRDPRDLHRVLEREEQAELRALVRLESGEGLALEADLAGRDDVRRPSHDDVRQRRLAAPVRAHDRVDLALPDDQIDPLQDLLALDLDAQPADLERRGSRLQRFSRRRHVRQSSTSTSSVSSSTLTVYALTGVVAGSESGLPLSRSNVDPCRGHSIVQSSVSTSPSDNEDSACEQVSSTARNRPSPRLATAMSRPPMSNRRASPSGTSVVLPILTSTRFIP